jgi:hypothetical protein
MLFVICDFKIKVDQGPSSAAAASGRFRSQASKVDLHLLNNDHVTTLS